MGMSNSVSVIQLNEVEGRCVVPGIVFAFGFVFNLGLPSKWVSEVVVYSIHVVVVVVVVGVEQLIHRRVRWAGGECV